MSLFIQSENQTILWETIHKIPVLHLAFPEGSQQNKIEWFKGHIEKKYAQLPPTISRNDLYKINREVLSGMSDHLQSLSASNTIHKNPSKSYQTVNTDMLAPAQMQVQDTTRGTFSRLQNPGKKTADYENTELQYKSLFDVPKPKVIDFTEKIEDDVITNMDELIENHKKMREQELQQFMPMAPPPSKTNAAPSNTRETMLLSNKISIMESIQKEELRPIVVEEKRVSFQLPSEENTGKMNTKTPTLLELQERYENIDNKMNEILDLLKNVLTKLPSVDSSVDSSNLSVDSSNLSVDSSNLSVDSSNLSVDSSNLSVDSSNLYKEYNDIEKIKQLMNKE